MRLAICVPWRGGDPSREYLWAMVRKHYEATGYPVFEGDSDPGPFNRSQARNRAADKALAAGADTLAFCDADTVIPGNALALAGGLAFASGGACYPYDLMLEQDPTDTSKPAGKRTTLAGGHPSSGNVVVSAVALDRVGGWDERAIEWGFEDGAFKRILSQVVPVQNIKGTIVTFDHSRLEEETPEWFLYTHMDREGNLDVPWWHEGYDDVEATIATIRAIREASRVGEAARVVQG